MLKVMLVYIISSHVWSPHVTTFVASGFDTQKLMKLITKSRTYQLSIATNKWNKDDEINYSHAMARRLSAETLYDSIHKTTGSQSKLPGLPPGSRAAQLTDGNVDLPGGFLDLFGKPVRESACECERSGGMNLGPIMAMVNGPVVADAIKDPNNRINQFVLKEKDDAKVVDEIYLSVLNRYPTAAERASGIKALQSAGKDHALMMAEYKLRVDALEAYKKTLDDRQAAWEKGLLDQKASIWIPLELSKATSKQGQPASAVPGATLTFEKDGSIFATGKLDSQDLYTVEAFTLNDAPITAVRLELLSDPRLPGKGPGRAENGNLVLTEFRVTSRRLDQPETAYAPLKLLPGAATFEQATFPLANAIDGNRATGWALVPEVGRNHAGIFKFEKPVSGPGGVAFTVQLEQQFTQAANHTIGKFRLSVTTDKAPRLGLSLTAAEIAVLETPSNKRTPADQAKMRARYLATDKEYARLVSESSEVPPTDARVLGAQDLTWALINSPAFLFNH